MQSKRLIAAGIATLILLTAIAAQQAQSRRILVICFLLACPAMLAIRRGLGGLEPMQVKSPVEKPVGVPDDKQSLVNTMLALEAQQEHAPIALFAVDEAGAVSPLNSSARRLIAPGRANPPTNLYEQLAACPAGQRTLITFDTEQGMERGMIASSGMVLHGEKKVLIALMPAESELEAETLKAWHQLVHVLTHEIMNSLTPVASLSHTARELLHDFSAALPPDTGGDLDTALDAISRRADSLVDFVNSYRHLSNTPTPQPERVRLADLFSRLSALVSPGWIQRGGRAEFLVDPISLEVTVDPGQLEQALINLIKNAADATANRSEPLVTVTARLLPSGRLRVEVCDNGPGVPDALIPHIFTPFFSTKEKGRGIGLAMARQLIHGNHGTVRYAKSVTAGARFVVAF